MTENPEKLSIIRPGYAIEPRSSTFLIQGFLSLGIAIRLTRYLLFFPLWGDEACLAANFISRDYGQLLHPLDYYAVAPVVFLWIEKTVINLFGFAEYSLRFFPTVCSILGVIIFYQAAKRILQDLPLLLSTAIFSVSYYLIRHGAEVKPYASDLFVSLVLLLLAIRYLDRPKLKRRLWELCAFVPVALALSYPAVFVAGGIGLTILYQAIKIRKSDNISGFIVYILLLLGSFTLTYLLFAQIQLNFELKTLGGKHMFSIWKHTFPPLHRPGLFILWMIRTHTGRMFAYPVGGMYGGSIVTFICFITGIVVLWRQRKKEIFLLIVIPFIMAFIAAAIRRYPYGYSARWMLYMAPFICIPVGLGAATLISFIKNKRWRKAATIGIVAGLGLIGLGCIARDVIKPYKEKADLNSRTFARYFWNHLPSGSELLCVKTDLGKDFFPGLFLTDHNSARYLCNQKIYSPRHQKGIKPAIWKKRAPGNKIRFVVYSVPGVERDDKRFSRWLKLIQNYASLTDYQCHKINTDFPKHREIYEVYEFSIE